MKLRLINEAGLNRRSFIQKTSAGATSLITGGWKTAFKMLLTQPLAGVKNLAMLYNALSPEEQKLVGQFRSNIVDTFDIKEYISRNTVNGMITSVYGGRSDIPKLNIPIEAVLGDIANMIEKDGYSAAAVLLTGESPEQLNVVFPGFIQKSIEAAVEKHGAQEFTKGIADLFGDFNNVREIFPGWKMVLNNQIMQKHLRMTPAMVEQTKESGRWLNQMVDRGMLNRQQANEWAIELQDSMPPDENQEKLNQEKLNQEKLNQEKLKQQKSQPPEEIVSHPDDQLASSMHQPFESRLDKAFGIIR